MSELTALIEDIRLLSESKFTVAVYNGALDRWHFEGHFDTEKEAQAHAKREASRSRKFATYTVYRGSPKNPGKETKFSVQGTK